MKKQIWKYPLTEPNTIALVMPKGAEILTVQMQGREPMLWALVATADTDAEPEKEVRKFEVFGTGQKMDAIRMGESPVSGTTVEVPIQRRYIATFQYQLSEQAQAMTGRATDVYHVFELLN